MGVPITWPKKDPIFERKISIRIADNATRKICEIDMPVTKNQMANDDDLNNLIIDLYQKFDIIVKEMFAPWQKSDPTKTIFGNLFIQALKSFQNDSAHIENLSVQDRSNSPTISA